MPRPENAILLRSLLLNGGQLFENGRDTAFLFLEFDLGIAHINAPPDTLRRVVTTEFTVGSASPVGTGDALALSVVDAACISRVSRLVGVVIGGRRWCCHAVDRKRPSIMRITCDGCVL